VLISSRFAAFLLVAFRAVVFRFAMKTPRRVLTCNDAAVDCVARNSHFDSDFRRDRALRVYERVAIDDTIGYVRARQKRVSARNAVSIS
jgi:hypothetical protein